MKKVQRWKMESNRKEIIRKIYFTLYETVILFDSIKYITV